MTPTLNPCAPFCGRTLHAANAKPSHSTFRRLASSRRLTWWAASKNTAHSWLVSPDLPSRTTGWCLLEKTGDWDEAYRQFIAARDLDGMPMRCLSTFQQAYFDVAERHDCVLVDGQALFHAIGPHGQLDDTLFADVMHPSLRGHIALASGILDALYKRRAFGWSHDQSAPLIDPARCAAHFGLHAS